MSKVDLNARSASSGHAGYQPPELLDRAFERRRPGKAAAETNVIAIVRLRGEHDAGRDTDALRGGGTEQLRTVDVARQLDPQDHTARRLRDSRAFGEEFRDRVDGMLGMNSEHRADASQVAIVAAARVVASEHELLQRRASDRRIEFGARDFRMKLRAHRPADAV